MRPFSATSGHVTGAAVFATYSTGEFAAAWLGQPPAVIRRSPRPVTVPQMGETPDNHDSFSRRDFIRFAAGAGAVIVGGSAFWPEGYAFGATPTSPATTTNSTLGTGTVPEQIHLVWGSDASRSVTVSWASPTPEITPQISLSTGGGPATVFSATAKQYTDGLSGETVHMYHVPLTGLLANTTYTYAWSATPPPRARHVHQHVHDCRRPAASRSPSPSFGDLGTPGAGATYTWAGETAYSNAYSESQWNAYNAVGEVEVLAPLFHLLHGDLCYGDKETINSSGQTAAGIRNVQPSPEVWRDFGLNVQRSAANRPWMPCIGNHEAGTDNGEAACVLQRPLPAPRQRDILAGQLLLVPGRVGVVHLPGRKRRVLSGWRRLQRRLHRHHGRHAIAGGSGQCVRLQPVLHGRLRSGQHGRDMVTRQQHAQTLWLQSVLSTARSDTTLDWIIVQMHQCALSSSTDNGCDAGIRQAWYDLFDQYEVDLVVNGHDHDYERSYPVRGFVTPAPGVSTWKGSSNTSWPSNYIYDLNGPVLSPAAASGTPVNTFTPAVVQTGPGPYNTSAGTVYMVIGGGGTNKRPAPYSTTANVTTFTQIRVGVPFDGIAAGTKPVSDASEPAAGAALTDTNGAYGVAYFSVNPGTSPGGLTTITVTYSHAPTQTSGTPNYTAYDTFQLVRTRSDLPAELPEFSAPALAVGAAAVIGGGALYLHQRSRGRDASLAGVRD